MAFLILFALVCSAHVDSTNVSSSNGLTFESMISLWPYMLLSVFGALIHLFGEMAQPGAGNSGAYWSSHIWASLKTLLTAIVAPVLLSSMDQLNVSAAFGAGYLADSLLMKFTSTKVD